MAITDLMILEGENVHAPSGWTKLPTDLNKGAGGAYLYLAYREGYGTPITDIMILDGKNAQAPSGWTKLPIDLNKEAGGWYLYLAYRKGNGSPIRNIKIVSSSSEAVGWNMVNRDLNKDAGGASLYIAYKTANAKTATIKRIFCIAPSTGYGSVASAAINTTFSVAGGIIGAVAGLATTNPAVVVVGGAVGAGAGTLAAELVNGIAEGIGPDFADDVYIKVNGDRIWPRSGSSRKMNKGDVEDVNYSFPLSGPVTLSIKEWDYVSDDDMGDLILTPNVSSGTLVFTSEEEGSVYCLEIIIE